VIRACEEAGIETEAHHAGTILPPGSVLTGNGDPYSVFTPFRKRWLSILDRRALEPLGRPRSQQRAGLDDGAERPSAPAAARSELPTGIDGVGRDKVRDRFPAGEEEAAGRLARFLQEPARRYDADRDFPAIDGTSTLSPYLAAGVISPRQCLHAAVQANGGRLADGNPGISAWITELIWRDFYRHVVALFPHVSRGQAFRTETDALAWRRSEADLAAWKEGRTGYPLVDAGMRQLNETGWMHNRLRMITAMFLSKHLLLDWREGERWFMNKLVDGDFAANNGGWQWSASTGTDAAPYFRIFNPHTQAKRFDPDGRFIRRWVPELADAPDRSLFDPDKHPVKGYPRPVVNHRLARQRALEAFKALKA
jgi:deoxyribodipyrimidine photo-lyase